MKNVIFVSTSLLALPLYCSLGNGSVNDLSFRTMLKKKPTETEHDSLSARSTEHHAKLKLAMAAHTVEPADTTPKKQSSSSCCCFIKFCRS